MIENKYFDDYRRAIDKDYVVCKEQIQLVEYLEKNILPRDDMHFNREMMDGYVKFSEKNFFQLALYQKFITSFIFLFWEKNSRVVFREFFVTLGRGGGKNGWLSTLGTFFISPLHGIPNYNVTITANSEKQAKTSFEESFITIQTKNLGGYYDAKKSAITGRHTNSKFTFRTNNPESADGARDGCLFFDEIHQYEDDRMVETQRSGLGKTKAPRTFYIGSNGRVREAFYDDQLEISRNILSGESKRIDYFPFICKIDDISELDKPELWGKANPMFNEQTEYAEDIFSEVKAEYDKLKEHPSGYTEFVIKRMNFTDGDGLRDVAPEKQIIATNRPIPNLDGKSCVAGFDYANIKDFASVGLLFKADDEYVFIQHSFARKETLDKYKLKAPIYKWADEGLVTILNEPSIDPRRIVNWLVEQREKYHIEIVIADGFRMDLLKPLLEENGFNYEFMRNPDGVQAKVAPIIEDGFANERFVFGNDPMMRWYIRNTYIKENKRGNRTFLKKEPVRRKTDGFHAFLAALYKRGEISEVDIGGVLDMLNSINF